MRPGVGKLVKDNNRWDWKGKIPGVDHQVRTIAQESDSVFWLTYEMASRITFSSDLQDVLKIETFGEENGVTADLSLLEAVNLSGGVRFASGNGLLHFDEQERKFLPDTIFNRWIGKPGQEVWAVTPDYEGRIWLYSKRSNGPLIRQPDQTYIWDTLALRPLRRTEVWKIVPQPDGIVWFCTDDGLYQFNTNIRKSFDRSFRVLINRVEINRDSIAYVYPPQFPTLEKTSINSMDLAFEQNNVRFRYDATSFYIHDELQFSYMLKGYDKEWSSWTNETIKEYTNLPARSFEFVVKASNSYGLESEPTGFYFTILPPWYQKWWAYAVYGLIFLGMILGLGSYQRKRIYLKQQAKIRMQEAEIEKEKEISHKLRNIDRLKDEFLAHTSHDLRTPLHGMIGITESIIDQIEKLKAHEIRNNLVMVSASGKRLASMVDSILDYSRLKTRDLVLKTKNIDLRSMTELVLRMSEPMIAKGKVKLVNNIPDDIPPVRGDENRLQQILYNLVGNAIKFTETGSITVGAQLIDNMVEVSIKDTGIGIPEDKREVIFDSFEQLDLIVDREYIGTGLGLTITKKLVELHGGKIWVESVINKGSTFHFTLPTGDNLSKTETYEKERILQESIGQPIGTKFPKGEYNILVVDDEPVNQQVLVNHLLYERYNVDVVSNGPDALSAINKKKYDLILLDVMMPSMSGFEVSKKIRESYLLSELPIIFVTAKDQIGDLVEGLSYGGNDYISKPFSGQELIARVKTHLNLYKINDSYARFIPHEFLESLGRETIIDVRLGDQIEKEVTIFFSDIRDYTALAEKMSPKENFNFLNHFLGVMGPVIRKNRGFILHYLGDGLMALFLGSSRDAMNAALEMQLELDKFNLQRIDKGQIPIRLGSGMHTGNLILGVLGDQKRMDANVVSDAVNTASRMEGLTKIYGASIIVSEDTISKIDPSDFEFRMLGIVRVKGKVKPIKIFELLNGDISASNQHKIETKIEFEKGLDHYYKKEFVEAASLFKKISKINEEDKAAVLYLKLSAHYLVDGVEDDWDGTSPGDFS